VQEFPLSGRRRDRENDFVKFDRIAAIVRLEVTFHWGHLAMIEFRAMKHIRSAGRFDYPLVKFISEVRYHG